MLFPKGRLAARLKGSEIRIVKHARPLIDEEREEFNANSRRIGAPRDFATSLADPSTGMSLKGGKRTYELT
jgi:hypothetical protein